MRLAEACNRRISAMPPLAQPSHALGAMLHLLTPLLRLRYAIPVPTQPSTPWGQNSSASARGRGPPSKLCGFSHYAPEAEVDRA